MSVTRYWRRYANDGFIVIIMNGNWYIFFGGNYIS